MKWIGYLQLGIFSLLLLFLLSSCNKTEFAKVDWIYVNKTGHSILIKNRFAPFTIEPFEEYIFEQGVVPTENSSPPYTKSRDFYRLDVIVYDSIKCDTLKSFEVGLWNVSNYQIEEVNDNYYQLTYHFTEADYERAVKCE